MKKSIFKTICSLTMAAAMVLTATACSSQTTTTEEATDTATQQESQTTTQTEQFKIGILQLTEHEALDKARNGFIDALAEGGYVDGEKIVIDFQNAQGDQSNLKTMSQKFVNDGDDLVLAIATPAAQSIAAETQDIPILATAITNYPEAGLVESNEAPGVNLSGTSDRTPVEEQLKLLKQILPEVQTVGILYNSSEANSEIQAGEAIAACDTLGLSYKEGTVTNVNDIQQVVQSIVTDVDALYIPTDNTFASAMPLVASITDIEKIPVICGEIGMVKGGGLATIGIDYYKLGQQTGEMAIRVLEGEDVSTMPIEFPDTIDICINLDTAEKIGVTIPQEVIDSAVTIIENGTETTAADTANQ